MPGRLATRCTRGGCDGEVGWSCSYRDRNGGACDTWWCKNHVEFVDGLAFCKRHAGVVKTINQTRGTVREIKTVPEVSDRSASLVNLVAEDLNEAILALLRNRFRGRRDVTVAADATPHEVWVERKEMAWDSYNTPYLRRVGKQLAWERAWSALTSQGHLQRIAIRVSTSEPPAVQVLVGPRPVAEGTPDWILRRLSRQSGHESVDRQVFAEKLLHAITDSV